MNLQAITTAAIGTVNPMVLCLLRLSTGSTIGADFTPVPSYAPAVELMGQIQSLTYRDLQMVEGLNLQGTKRSIYLQGDVEGVVRPESKGGDLITMPDGTVWLVAMVLENWNPPDGSKSGWVKVACVLQNGS